MASKKLEKGSDEWHFFQDFWKYRQQYYEPEDSDKWFDEVINESDKLLNKYKDTGFKEFAKQLITAHVEDLDRRCKIHGQS